MVVKKREAHRAEHRYLTNFAREMRHEPTQAEKLLWSILRNRQVADAKFKRQYPIGEYIADFACIQHKLVIELDGPLHADQVEYDAARDRFIATQGYRVLRFPNSGITSNLRTVEAKILAALTPRPR